ncbi:MAG: hypothetical protein H6721_15820 [Sandaracinus sp.]|nr:hypothetical protein [Sandaracinus sp.]
MKRLFFVAFALAACSPSGLRVATTPDATLAVAGLTREIDAVRDLDDVRDVADLNGTLAVATDRGVLLFAEGDERPTRLLDGLPSPDVRALAAHVDGSLIVGTAEGLARVRGAQVEPIEAPPVGELVALATTSDGHTYACGATGLAIDHVVDQSFGWQTFGEPFACTGLWPTPEEHLWVGTTRGLLYVEGDVVREHGETGGLPGGYVRGVVPAGTGRALALVQGPSDAWIVFFDGERWTTYTVPDLDRRPVGLARLGADAILVTPDHAFVIREAARATGGVPLRALSRGPHRPALSYRAGLGRPAVEGTLERREPAPLAAVPPNAPTVAAPGFGIAHLSRVGTSASFAKTLGREVWIADRSRGVRALSESGIGPHRSSRSLVDERDLQIAADERSGTFTIDALGRVGRFRDGGFVPVATPEGARAWALASGNRGLYLAATVPTDRAAIRIYRRDGENWVPVVERRVTGPGTPTTLVEPTAEGGVATETGTLAPDVTLVSLPFFGITDDETAWVAVRVEENGQVRRKGVVQLSARTEEVLHHHYGQPAGGSGALQLPDDTNNVDLGQSGFAWFSSVVGAVRLGNSQSVTFGEARGVRGEVVSDVLVGTGNRVWVAAAEGPGYYFQQTFEFRMPQAVRAARPLALALDAVGDVWGAGSNGLVRFDGTDWQIYGADVLPVSSFVDLEADPEGRLWVLAEDRVLIVGPGRRIEE